MRHHPLLIGLAALGLTVPAAVTAATLHAELAITSLTGPTTSVGSVDVSDGPSGAIFTLQLHGLPAGPHGFHIHQVGSCAAAAGKDGMIMAAGAAGGHLDPLARAKHLGPEGDGHLGDLPRILVASDGTAGGDLLAPRIKDVAALKGRSLMIHAGGDNYSDQPAPLGGGGARLACGVLN